MIMTRSPRPDDNHATAAPDHLTERDYTHLADLVERHAGIKMPVGKRLMVEGRLRRRSRALGLPSLNAYCHYLFAQGGLDDEFQQVVDAITTNKTDFFREPVHFERLVDTIIPDLLDTTGAGRSRPLDVWSAACSSGPEPYTLAMVLSDVAAQRPGFRFSIGASDISHDILQAAARAVYPEQMIEPVPHDMRRRYLLRSRDQDRPTVRICPEVRQQVTFRDFNLLTKGSPWQRPMDVIFCRNVLIYFSPETQQAVLANLCDSLRSGGYLLVGHSESLNNLDLPVTPVGPAMYRRK